MMDETAVANQKLWEDEVQKGSGYTIPWLDLDLSLLRRFANGELAALPEPLDCISPSIIFANVAGKDVLCLAAGGGQQTAVFGLLGANVTVVDLTAGQLRGDQRAAAHYGYPITCVQADMRDLSALDDSSFDLVFQADSFSYVPNVRQVYSEVARVLRPNGLYRTKHYQPVAHSVEADDQHYRIARPYAQKIYRRADGGIEYRHYMDDIFEGLLESELQLKQVIDVGRAKQPAPQAIPGSWAHQDAFIGGGFVIVTEKREL